QRLGHLIEDADHARLVADIAGQRQRAPTSSLDLARIAGQPLRVASDQRDRRALRGEEGRRRAPDATAGAGEHGDFAGQRAARWLWWLKIIAAHARDYSIREPTILSVTKLSASPWIAR